MSEEEKEEKETEETNKDLEKTIENFLGPPPFGINDIEEVNQFLKDHGIDVEEQLNAVKTWDLSDLSTMKENKHKKHKSKCPDYIKGWDYTEIAQIFGMNLENYESKLEYEGEVPERWLDLLEEREKYENHPYTLYLREFGKDSDELEKQLFIDMRERLDKLRFATSWDEPDDEFKRQLSEIRMFVKKLGSTKNYSEGSKVWRAISKCADFTMLNWLHSNLEAAWD
jgi:hypothetical protein